MFPEFGWAKAVLAVAYSEPDGERELGAWRRRAAAFAEARVELMRLPDPIGGSICFILTDEPRLLRHRGAAEWDIEALRAGVVPRLPHDEAIRLMKELRAAQSAGDLETANALRGQLREAFADLGWPWRPESGQD